MPRRCRATRRRVIARGEVWWADSARPRGSEPGYIRPVLILSDDRYNTSRLRTVTVLVLSTNTRLAALPGNVSVPSSISGLPHDSVANVTQIATLDRGALTDRAGHPPNWVLAQSGDGLRLALGPQPMPASARSTGVGHKTDGSGTSRTLCQLLA